MHSVYILVTFIHKEDGHGYKICSIVLVHMYCKIW